MLQHWLEKVGREQAGKRLQHAKVLKRLEWPKTKYKVILNITNPLAILVWKKLKVSNNIFFDETFQKDEAKKFKEQA